MSPRPIDLTRARAGLARLDALLAAHPELREPEAQARLTAWLEEQRGMRARKGKQTGDVKTRARVQRLREKRKQEGWQQHELWLNPEAAGILARLKHRGESLHGVVRRALLALEAQERYPVAQHVPSNVCQEAPSERPTDAVTPPRRKTAATRPWVTPTPDEPRINTGKKRIKMTPRLRKTLHKTGGVTRADGIQVMHYSTREGQRCTVYRWPSGREEWYEDTPVVILTF
jgi:hypothetical protein